MATNVEAEGDGIETMMDIDSSEDEVGDIAMDQPNKLESNDKSQCNAMQCLRAATTKCGKCNGKVCDIHIGSFSKQYTVLCKLCDQQRLSSEYDKDNKCPNKCKRIICTKCGLLVIGILILLLVFAILRM